MSAVRRKRTTGLAAACIALAVAGSAAAQDGGEVPRMANGKPDLSGVWWGGGDVGGPGFRVGGPGRGEGPPPATFTGLYQPWAAEHAATLSDKDDPTLQCVSTAFGTLNVRMYDVGAVAQIVATPDLVVLLSETFHGYQLVPTDGRDHPPLPPARRGHAVGHWDGDTFVVEVENFTDDTWIWAEGRVSFHSDALRVVERYQRVDADTLVVDATVYDPEVLTEPWVVPTQTLEIAPFDMLFPLDCSGVETQELMDAAAELEE
ncbi:MAG TPA: hypothetical protein VMR74_12890 [Gammaproteobacteria bacterium]|nr:hypothetical protein [Gammaproteobacteria bacterium]